MLISALRNRYFDLGEQMVNLLLLKYLSLKISRSMLVAAIEGGPPCVLAQVRKMEKLLASNISLDVVTSERVLIAAAKSMTSASKLLQLLLCKDGNSGAILSPCERPESEVFRVSCDSGCKEREFYKRCHDVTLIRRPVDRDYNGCCEVSTQK
ncbi:hypothetical protein BDD12DRAFT_833457 [Trichophaea hybrida]|nr:hypothetical protein BDD12DRAFT_833457 [Trichophaea hybrida]